MPCDMLHEINHEKDAWKVKVRIIRLWDAITSTPMNLLGFA